MGTVPRCPKRGGLNACLKRLDRRRVIPHPRCNEMEHTLSLWVAEANKHATAAGPYMVLSGNLLCFLPVLFRFFGLRAPDSTSVKNWHNKVTSVSAHVPPSFGSSRSSMSTGALSSVAFAAFGDDSCRSKLMRCRNDVNSNGFGDQTGSIMNHGYIIGTPIPAPPQGDVFGGTQSGADGWGGNGIGDASKTIPTHL